MLPNPAAKKWSSTLFFRDIVYSITIHAFFLLSGRLYFLFFLLLSFLHRREKIGAALHPDDELVIFYLLQEYLQLPSSQDLVSFLLGGGG